MLNNHQLIEAIASSPVYRDYERAFRVATGLPLSLRSVENWRLPNHGKPNENGFCAAMAEKSATCAASLRTQEKLSNEARKEAKTTTCAMGLSETAVPVRNGEETILFLQTGQVFHTKPDAARFGRAAKQLAGLGIDAASVRELYFKTRVVPAKEYAGAVTLLGIFALQLSALGNQMALQRRHSEFEPVTRAKEYINSHQMEELSLGAVAKAVHMSTFYFCKMFKKSTGLNFSDYVRRLRTEKAKNLLLNRNLRVSEIAYAIGFQSLTNFNRTFRLIVGKSPTEYRANFAVLSAA